MSKPRRSRTRIMVISPGPRTALKLADRLAADGYEVATSRTHDEALDVMGMMNPDALILDCHGHDQGRLVSLIRQRCPDVPVIAVIEPKGPGVVDDSLKAGADACLLAPSQLADVSRVLRARIRPAVAAMV